MKDYGKEVKSNLAAMCNLLRTDFENVASHNELVSQRGLVLNQWNSLKRYLPNNLRLAFFGLIRIRH